MLIKTENQSSTLNKTEVCFLKSPRGAIIRPCTKFLKVGTKGIHPNKTVNVTPSLTYNLVLLVAQCRFSPWRLLFLVLCSSVTYDLPVHV